MLVQSSVAIGLVLMANGLGGGNYLFGI